MAGIIFFLAVPIIFLTVIVQLIVYFKKRPVEKKDYWIIHGFGLFGLFVTLMGSGVAIFYIISEMPPFCANTGCQAFPGYLYMFATPFIVVFFCVSEVLFFIGCSSAEENKT